MMTPRQKRPLFSALLLTLIVLPGCTLKLSYHWLDWWMQSQLENYVDLNREQTVFAAAAIDDFHQWHRYQALPQYTSFLDDFIDTLQQPDTAITRSQVQAWLADISRFWDESMLQLTRPGADLLQQLSEPQLLEALATAAAEEQEDYEDWQQLNPEARKQKQQARILKRLKPWVGQLTNAQQTRLAEWADQRLPTAGMALTENQRWRETLLQLWQQHHGNLAQLEAGLAALLTQPDQLWREDYREAVQQNRQQAISLIVELLNGLTSKQRTHLVKKLRGYQSSFSSLSDRPATTVEAEPNSADNGSPLAQTSH